jgi:hypothetical protein
MNEDYVMRPGDTFVARECGCSMTVNTGPGDSSMATQPPRCCCGHSMIKDASFVGGVDIADIKEERPNSSVLPGMLV